MREYFEKESKIEAFQSDFTYKLGKTQVNQGDWLVIKDGVAIIMTSEEFNLKYTKKTINHTIINYPSPKSDYLSPRPYHNPFKQPYYGDMPFWGELGSTETRTTQGLRELIN